MQIQSMNAILLVSMHELLFSCKKGLKTGLEQRKIELQEQLAMTTSVERFKAIDEELYEINDTIKKLLP